MYKFLLFFLFISSSAVAQRAFLKRLETQVDLTLVELEGLSKKSGIKVSPRTVRNDSLILVAPRDWCAGFFPGNLWYLHELTGNKKWKEQAGIYTQKIESEKLNGGTHDLGFKMLGSFGNGWRLEQNEAYKEILIQSAKTLATRFNSKAGVIRSWDHSRDKWNFPVIIDNMMNLELLFWAFNQTKDSSFYRIAVSHANTTMKNHFRPDFSSYHVVDYDVSTGLVTKKNTHQGYAHESAWSRGQAWALYGYAVCYRETGDKKYVQMAENIAQFIFSHPRLPADLIPYWDFDDPKIPNVPRDASAAAVTASALYQLALVKSRHAKDYVQKADKIIQSLSTAPYLADVGTNHGFLLKHSTGGLPNGFEVDAPIVYADYYYLEALLYQKKLK
jgi:unsaturated chondroitin disaccharide hydrolase